MGVNVQAGEDPVRALLDPRNVAIVGASDRPGSWSKKVADVLRRCGYRGAVYPVNPRAQTVWGEACWPDLASLPERPDHVAVVVPGAAAVTAVREAGRAGARSATIFASGFGEGGDAGGRALAEELRAAIIESGLAVSGPNCMGNLAAPFGFATMTDDRIASLPPGSVAVLGQSGGIVMAIFRALRGRGAQPGYALTTGNEIGLTSADYIRFFARDPETRVIACFIEAIRDPAAFIDACREARLAGKPIVALKIGGSKASREAALAHTGSLAGSLECFDAVTEPLGVIRVPTLDDLIETVEYFAHAPAPRGPRLAGMTFSGGLKGLMLETAARHGLSFPPLAADTIAKLSSIAGVGTSLGNPFDAGFAALSSADAYFAFVRAILADPNVDALIVQEELPPAPGMNAKAANLELVDSISLEIGKPVAVTSMASYMFTDFTREFRASFPHLPVLQEVDRALRAVAAAGRYGSLPPAPPPKASAPIPAELENVLSRGAPAGENRRALGESDSKAILAHFGIRAPREIFAADAAAAVKAASEIGFPVVLKVVSAQALHKTEVGGVLIGLADAAAVGAGFEKLRANLRERAPQAQFDGALVAQMVPNGLELALGVQRDPEVGPVVMFGAGGILLELARDVAFGPTPLTPERAAEMIASTSAGRLLAGYRGSKPRDRKAVADALVDLGRLAHALGDRLESIDVNPLVALEQGCLALDCLVVLRDG